MNSRGSTGDGRGRGRAFGGELAKPLQVLGGDAVQRIELDRVRVGVARVGVAAELGQRLAQPVVRIDFVGEHVEDFAVDLGSLIPAILHRQRDCLFGLGALLAQPVLSGKRSHTPPCAGVSGSSGRTDRVAAESRTRAVGPLSLAPTRASCNGIAYVSNRVKAPWLRSSNAFEAPVAAR